MLFFFKVMPRFHLFTVYVIHCHIQMEKYLKTSLAPFLYIDMYDEKCQKYNQLEWKLTHYATMVKLPRQNGFA